MLEADLRARSNNSCELCGSTEALSKYSVGPESATREDIDILVCGTCKSQLEKKAPPDHAHWQCLSGSMWSEVPAVQVITWRMLNRLSQESWAMEYLDMMYLDEPVLAWARASGDHENSAELEFHRDINGAVLADGDSVVLTKSLDVKGSTLTAKLGTVVKNIRLVENNTDQIEGKVEGQLIVILTKYVRKQ